jgi:hypothetical protein
MGGRCWETGLGSGSLGRAGSDRFVLSVKSDAAEAEVVEYVLVADGIRDCTWGRTTVPPDTVEYSLVADGTRDCTWGRTTVPSDTVEYSLVADATRDCTPGRTTVSSDPAEGAYTVEYSLVTETFLKAGTDSEAAYIVEYSPFPKGTCNDSLDGAIVASETAEAVEIVE